MDFEKIRLAIGDQKNGLGQLLLERPFDTAAPVSEVDTFTSEYLRILRIRSNVDRWPTKRLLKQWSKLKHRDAHISKDIGSQRFQLWDPAVADTGERIFARAALEALDGSEGCSPS